MAYAVKMCGLDRPAVVDAAVGHGAAYVGFVFYPASPRHLKHDAARALAARVPPTVKTVAVLVEPGDAEVEALLAQVRIDFLQLHGAESPARVTALKARFGRPVIKALAIAERQDLAQVSAYAPVADMLLLDGKAQKSEARPGGLGRAFDWTLLAGLGLDKPWFLSGGLTPETIVAAAHETRASAFDVSSGIEAAPGVKDIAKIAAFMAALQQVENSP
ncbi:MAG: phosphoribosylanthranilate isomerase [Pseudomonadota bacterium]|jgi:phosphoribosylanthranilate isomerase